MRIIKAKYKTCWAHRNQGKYQFWPEQYKNEAGERVRRCYLLEAKKNASLEKNIYI